MRNKIITSLLLSSSLCSWGAPKKQQPNIILFLVDDMGWQDTSVPFWKEKTPLNKIYKTPNMERLAQKGMKFTNVYACPVSSPSRISLLTGANVTQHRVSNWTLHKNQTTDKTHPTLDFESWNVNGMSPDSTVENAFYAKALPEILHEHGYETCIVGKAHLGALNTPAENPINIGFQVNIAGHAAGAMGSYLGEEYYGNPKEKGKKNIWGVPGLEKYHGTSTFLTDALTLEACHFMDNTRKENKPFFLYLSHYAVHAPFGLDKRFYDKYIEQGLSPLEARYAALVEGMDKSLGDIMDYLDEHHISDNTIILFMSDNGGYSVGRGGEKAERNFPLRGGKGACYEGGIREPMIVYWPHVTPENATNTSPVIIEDFYPSILQMAGINDYTTPQTIDGISFVKTLKSEKTRNEKRPLVFHFPNYWGEARECVGIPQSAIIRGDWKLVYTYENQTAELYNLNEDIREQNNLYNNPKYHKIGVKLANELTQKIKKYNANMPIEKASGKRVAYPNGSR